MYRDQVNLALVIFSVFLITARSENRARAVSNLRNGTLLKILAHFEHRGQQERKIYSNKPVHFIKALKDMKTLICNDGLIKYYYSVSIIIQQAHS